MLTNTSPCYKPTTPPDSPTNSEKNYQSLLNTPCCGTTRESIKLEIGLHLQIYQLDFYRSSSSSTVWITEGKLPKPFIDSNGLSYKTTNDRSKLKYEGEVKNGKAHGSGKLYEFKRNDLDSFSDEELWEDQEAVLLYDAIWKEGQLVSGKNYKRYYYYEGEFNKTGQFHGHGCQFRYNGSKSFEGNFKNDKRNGHGCFFHWDGSKYLEGNFKNDKQHGHGCEFRNNGSKCFEGNYKNDKQHGHGCEFRSDGSKCFEGNFKNDEKHGHGCEFRNGGIKCFEGNFKNDKKNGHGCLFRDGIKYFEGNFKNDKKNGHGTISKPGYFFEGNFENDKMNGHGTEIKSNGEKYIGLFANDSYNGNGFLQYESGASYTGMFKDGKPFGKGTKFRSENTIWKQGEFDGLNLHGKGTLFDKNGNILKQGKFIHGRWFDEVGLQLQKYMETKDRKLLEKITVNDIQTYMTNKLNMNVNKKLSKKN